MIVSEYVSSHVILTEICFKFLRSVCLNVTDAYKNSALYVIYLIQIYFITLKILIIRSH